MRTPAALLLHAALALALALAVALAVIVLSLLAGCETQSARSNLDHSIASFDKGEYDLALDSAEKAAHQATNTKEADEAAYMAGMSAFRLENYAAAERWLSQATRSSDAWTAGQAGVMLGNARLKLSEPREAASAFAAAAQKLEGEDARKARIAAGNAFKEAGDSRAADEQFRLANGPTSTAQTQTSPPTATQNSEGQRGGPATASRGPYVLQAGAFRDRSKAQGRADELRAKSMRAGLGEPRIAAKRSGDGSSLYAVQLGGFPDRRSAERALGSLGASGVVVINTSVAAGTPSTATR